MASISVYRSLGGEVKRLNRDRLPRDVHPVGSIRTTAAPCPLDDVYGLTYHHFEPFSKSKSKAGRKWGLEQSPCF
jgi:hypothetical protein